MKELKGKKIFVGLSGGVDSAVTAALLQQASANVIGIFIKGWYPPGMSCTWADDRRDAMRVAAHLHIPFHTLDASAEYKKGVIDYLLSEYAAGRTPNPDVMCNREVKFGAFYEFAHENGVDFIATGHYARTSKSSLLRGIDSTKDQSYFLWAVPKDVISRTIFPIGTYEKTNVRKLAAKLKLPVAAKRDSQGICFLGSVSVDEFLRQELKTKPGIAVSSNGREVGMHDGAVLYTIGERIALQNSTQGPWYVTQKDMNTNILIVSHEHSLPINSSEVALRETNWFENIDALEIVEAQYRYHGPLVQGTIDQRTGIFTPTKSFPEPFAKGQSLVIYIKEKCIGGGIIS